MLLDDFYDFLEIVVGILMVIEPVGKLLQRLKEAVQVHLVVITPPYHILVNYVIVSFEYMIIGQAGVLRQPLELGARYEVVALLPG